MVIESKLPSASKNHDYYGRVILIQRFGSNPKLRKLSFTRLSSRVRIHEKIRTD